MYVLAKHLGTFVQMRNSLFVAAFWFRNFLLILLSVNVCAFGMFMLLTIGCDQRETHEK